MSYPVLDIREAIPEVGRVLSAFLAKGQQPTPSKQQAIRAVWSAVDNTRMYIRMIRDGAADASASNPDLVALWSEASLQIAELDPALALRLRDKADYWSDPQRWDDPKIRDAAIGIDAVASDARSLLQLAVPHPHPATDSRHAETDVFLSHASEDKDTVVRPLATELEARGHTVWYDEFELVVGDRLTAKLDRGLGRCRFGAVVLSNYFIAKEWPRMELEGLLALETCDGHKRILSVRHGLSQAEVVAFSPLFGGRISVSTEIGIPAVADALATAIRRETTAC